ncbi:MAG: CoA-binding protein [Candidatus Diapherotrites archaeon]
MKELDFFFYPKTVAVIGASREPGKVGHAIMQNFTSEKFEGKVFPVNPKAEEIMGFKAHSSIAKIKERIDLAVICTPSATVPKVFLECCKKKVPAVIIISAGFEEIGNKELTNSLRALIKKYPKTRVVGPNCLGTLNCANGVDTLFLPQYRLERPEAGVVSFISQSGALGSAVLDWSSMNEYGIAKFASYGNAMDVDESDLLEYLANDLQTKVIVMYIEGVKNGKKFFETAKKYAKKKPIIVLKGGTTEAGTKAVASHTGSMAGSMAAYDAVFKQTGLIKANNLLELFDYARVLSRLPPAKGKRVQIITDGGGYGVVTADEVINHGLELAKMSEKSIAEIRKVVPPYVILRNPMDLTGDANNERYQVAVEAALKDKNVDMVIAIVLYQVPSLDSDVVETIRALNEKSSKPMIVISVGGAYSEVHKRALEREGVVNFSYPDDAVKALKALVEFYAEK